MVLHALTKTGKWILYLLAALLILIALLAASVRLAVLYSEDYSEELASVVSSYVGSPVEIGSVDIVWNRFDASASLKDVQIRSTDSAETILELPQLELQLNVRDMLLERNLSVRSVQLNNLSLAASYEGRGKIKMLGRKGIGSPIGSQLSEDDENLSSEDVSGEEETANRGYSVLSWLFNAERIAILDSDITLIDALRDREYKVDHINIRAFNDNDLHQIRVTSALPGDVTENTLASFDFIGSADDISAWKGQFYLNADRLNINHLSDFWRQPTESYSGTTDMEVWGKWSGTRVNEVRAIGSANNLKLLHRQAFSDGSTRGGSTLSTDASLQIDNAAIDLDWNRTDAGWQLKFNRLSAQLEDQVVLDGLDLHSERSASGYRQLRVSGPDISLQAFQSVYAYIDAVTELSYPLQVLRRGEIRNWLIGGAWLPQGFQLNELKADTDKLTVDPFQNNPGFTGLSASVLFKDGTGQLNIDNQDISLSLPALYDKPLPVINADGVVKFLVEQAPNSSIETLNDNATQVAGQAATSWKVVSEDLRLSSLDLNTSASFSLHAFADGKRLIDLHTSIHNANLTHIKDYYPTRVMKPKLLAWLQNSVEAGDIVRGKIEVKGDLSNFAPARGIGHLYVESDVVGAKLKFRPDWPAVEEMEGNISLTANAMRGRVYQGKMREAKFSDARLYLSDFKRPVLELETNAIGPFSDMLEFAQAGPLANKIGPFFGDATGSGVSRLSLDLNVPLKKELRDELAVNGELLLDNAQITANKFGIDLESVSGKVRFNRAGVLIDDLLVRYQGLPLSVAATQLGGASESANRISIEGPVAVASVMRSYGIPLTDQFEGVSDWIVDIDIHRLRGKKPVVKLTARSDLSGTRMIFPVPLDKSANSLHEIRVSREFGKEKDWWVELPGLAKARFRVASDRKLESMAVALGKSNNTVLPWRGIALHGDVVRLDALGWIKLALKFQSNSKGGGEPFPLFANVSARQMMLGNETGADPLGELVYIAYRDGDHQVHRVENGLVSGQLKVRGSKNSGEPLVAELDRLDKRLFAAIAAAEKNNVTNEVTSPSYDPRQLRPMDVSVKELKWDDWRFSRVSLRTQPTERGMQITALNARQDAVRFSGSGHWHYDGGVSHSTGIDLNASFENFGQAITAMGGGNSFAQGAGEAALSLAWPKPAYAPDLQAMTGQLLFTLRDGRILTVEPGAGRILGLFALQALPRRLAFDFRDMTDKGLEYTNISGNLSISDGQAQTNAIVVTGPVAEILIRGSTDFVVKTYDQTIDVLPRVSGALPLLGVLSGGPVAGLTALLADGFLRGMGINLDEIGRKRFTLTGNWDSPEWRTVNLANR